MNETSSNLDGPPRSNQPFPIERLHVSIFALILQAIVDDEAADMLNKRTDTAVKPVAAVNLALVCTRWRDTVYGFPSLWPIISLDLNKPLEEVQMRCDRLSQRSLNAPVDLYLWNIHLHPPSGGGNASNRPYHDPETCACLLEGRNEGGIAIDFSQITNIRNLMILFSQSPAASSFKTSVFSPNSLNNLHTLVLFILSDSSNPPLDLKALLINTPRLVVLDFNSVGIASLGFAKQGESLLPDLRTLKLSASYNCRATPNILPQFLSHAPNIHVLEAFFLNFDKKAPLEPFPSITLPHLRRLVIQSFEPLRRTFSEGIIQTPLLEDLFYYEWDNAADEECRKFLSLNPSIKKLFIAVTDTSHYGSALTSAINVDEFGILGGGKGAYLAPLYAKEAHPYTKLPLPICPKVRTLNLLVQMTPIQPTYFEGLVKARCRPVKEVDGVCYTANGYRAVEVLRFTAMFYDMFYPKMMETTTWQSAEVTKISKMEYELRWSYHSDAVAPIASSEEIIVEETEH